MRRVNGEVYNFSSKGYLTTGIKKVYGRLYLFDENGKVVRRSGWYTSKKGNKYYLKSNGSLVTGYKKIGDDFYFFSETNGRMYKTDGHMQRDTSSTLEKMERDLQMLNPF